MSSQSTVQLTPSSRFSASGLSIFAALLLALWELYFFLLAGTNWMGKWDPQIPLFRPEMLGFKRLPHNVIADSPS